MSEKKVNEQAKTNFKVIGGAIVFFGMLAVIMVMVISGKSQKTESLVTPMQHPDRATETEHSPRYKETVQSGNEQRRQEALKTGQAAIPTIIGETAADHNTPGFPNENPHTAAAAPPVPPQTAAQAAGRVERDEKEKIRQMTIDHLLESEWGKGPDQTIVLVSTGEKGGDKSSSAVKGETPSPPGASQDKSAEGVAIEKGALCYGVIHSPINTDNPGRITGELIHCPGKTKDFSGAKIYGTFDRQNTVLAVKFDLMHHKGIGYPITALALDEKTSSGVLSGDVDKHIFIRYWVPLLSEFVAGWGTAASRSNTNVTVSLAGSTQTQGELSTTNQLLAASGQASKTVNQIAQEAIKGREITVKREGNTTIGIVFLDAVKDAK